MTNDETTRALSALGAAAVQALDELRKDDEQLERLLAAGMLNSCPPVISVSLDAAGDVRVYVGLVDQRGRINTLVTIDPVRGGVH